MKKFSIIICLIFMYHSIFSQGILWNRDSTFANKIDSLNILQPKKIYEFKNMTGIPCSEKIFWGSNSDDGVYEFEFNGNSIINNGRIISTDGSRNGASLAFANNISGGSFSPTFYSSDAQKNAFYFDGTSWVLVTATPNCDLYNSAAFGNKIFYQYGGAPTCIEQYDGSSFNLLDSAIFFTIADLAVDADSNLWYIKGPDFSSNNIHSICVISPNGLLLKTFDFKFNTDNAYGCFISGNTLYLGIGHTNPIYPNSILPLTFTNDSVIIGTPLPMPGEMTDLASCAPGRPLSLSTYTPQTPADMAFEILPNPVNQFLTLRFNFKTKKGNIQVYDVFGRKIFSTKLNETVNNSEYRIDTENLLRGEYLIYYTDDIHSIVKKFIK